MAPRFLLRSHFLCAWRLPANLLNEATGSLPTAFRQRRPSTDPARVLLGWPLVLHVGGWRVAGRQRDRGECHLRHARTWLLRGRSSETDWVETLGAGRGAEQALEADGARRLSGMNLSS